MVWDSYVLCWGGIMCVTHVVPAGLHMLVGNYVMNLLWARVGQRLEECWLESPKIIVQPLMLMSEFYFFKLRVYILSNVNTNSIT